MRDQWPCGRPVVLRWLPEVRDEHGEYCGDAGREGRRLVIRMSERMNRTWVGAIETLAHEYAHCVLWGPASLEDDDRVPHHPPAFWAQYGEIIDRWNHDHGAEQAKEYPTR